MKPVCLMILGFVAVLTCVSGCATTREDRIRAHQSVFDSWPEAVQEDVRQGRVRVGFTPEMVRVALGEPNHTYVRETDDSETTIWGYTSQLDAYHRHWPAPTWVFSTRIDSADWYHRRTAQPYWYIHEREYEHLRVEFRDNKVISIERLMERSD